MQQIMKRPAREPVLRWTMGAAIALWSAYVMYGMVDGQGLVGWLSELGVRRYGSVSTNMVLVVALAVGVMPLRLVFGLVARGLGVRLMPRRGARPVGSPRQILTRSIASAAAILVAAAGLVAIVLPGNDHSPPVRFDLDATPDAAPPAAQRVAVVGTPRTELAAGYRETRGASATDATEHRFIPLTGGGWTPGTPVRFFLAEVSDEKGARGIVAAPDRDARTRFEGKLRRNGMNAIARGAFERNGVRFAEPYWALYNYDDQARSLLMFIAVLGLVLPGAVIAVGLRDARIARGAASAGPTAR
jgi:hypothetical protein